MELRAGGVEKEFVPFLFHFMGCAGRSGNFYSKTTQCNHFTNRFYFYFIFFLVSTQSGHQCKYERIQKFLKEEYDLEC